MAFAPDPRFPGRRRIVALVATLILWALIAAQHVDRLRSGTDPACSTGSCTSAEQYYSNDPYCFFDPTCVSPLYKSNWQTEPTEQWRWQGIDWSVDPTLAPSRLDVLAPLNYMAYLFVALSLVGLSGLFSSTVGSTTRTIVAEWTILESIRWMLVLGSVSNVYVYSQAGLRQQLFGMLVAAVLSSPVLFAVWLVSRRRSTGTTSLVGLASG